MPDYDINAYESPQFPQEPQGGRRRKSAAKGRLMPPAIVLIVLSGIGVALCLFNIIYALTMDAQVDPNAPEMLQSIQKNTVGPVAAITQSFFFFVNLVVIFGAISMLKMKTYPLAIAGSIAAMINIGSCCCVPSVPFAIWALVLLSREDTKKDFK